MRPHVILAQSKELVGYLRTVDELDIATLSQINKRLLKIQQEVSETLETFDKKQ